MFTADSTVTIIDEVRARERRRIAAMRANDVASLEPLLDDNLVYINSVGKICDKSAYLGAIRSHGLTYEKDFDVRETECRVMEGLVILAGVMRGHSRLDGEQQVFRCTCVGVWREQSGDWRMVAWQSSSSSIKGY